MRIPSGHLEAHSRPDASSESTPSPPAVPATQSAPAVEEIGGPSGPEPTRYGDWERSGRCIDF